MNLDTLTSDSSEEGISDSVWYKFESIKDLLNRNILDILFLSETKIDDSFTDALFSVDNYHLWRADRTDRGGGVAAYLRTDIAGDRQKDYECKHIESISVEVNLQSSKILICGAYKPPSMTDDMFENDCSLTLDKISSKYDNYILLGDLNFDMLCEQKCSSLMNMCDIFDLKNLIKKPTCYTSNSNPSLVDVILTNSDTVSKIGGTCNFSSGLSDVHNVIACQLKFEIPENKSRWCNYRSFKHFDNDSFNNDLQNTLNLSAFQDSGNVHLAYQNFSNTFLDIANKHAPLKKKKVLPKPLPYMNKNLKQEIYKKKMLFNKFQKCRSSRNWENFRKQGNLVVSMKRKSMNKYFIDRCVGGCKSADFWPTIKPLLTNKGNKISKDVILKENNSLINDQNQICEVFNDFFINVAKILEQIHCQLMNITPAY